MNGCAKIKHLRMNRINHIPLAERMRPKTLEDYFGQEHLVGPEGTFRRMIQNGTFPSLILWGPPGTGKTTLAHLLTQAFDRPFFSLSAISSGVKELREIIQKAGRNNPLFSGKNPVVFIDEIHRFSKSQQDALLGAVEKGTITLIGATTENPSFEVINALLSRCQVYVLYPLSKKNLKTILECALNKDAFLIEKSVVVQESEAIIELCGGDARKMLSILELVVNTNNKNTPINNEMVIESLQTQNVHFDKNGDFHYDIISAFIKSIRGSDPNAAVYWLARMVEAGEDIKFIARRLLILASEDIGIANPTAVVLANATFQAVSAVGYPEGRILLSECAIYLASSPKSNAAYVAIKKAQETVANTGNLAVPLHLRNAPTKLMKNLGYGQGYQYAHDFDTNFINQEFLPEAIKGQKFYEPGNNPKEESIRQFLSQRWKNKYDY